MSKKGSIFNSMQLNKPLANLHHGETLFVIGDDAKEQYTLQI